MESFVRSGIKNTIESMRAQVKDKMPKPPFALPTAPAKKIDPARVKQSSPVSSTCEPAKKSEPERVKQNPSVSATSVPAKKNVPARMQPCPFEPMSVDEIAYNLSIMKQTIDGGKGAAIDLGFIEIFHTAIADQKGAKSNEIALKELTKNLEAQERRLYEAKFGKLESEVAVRKCVENKASLNALADSYGSCAVKEGLKKLHKEGFSYRPVIGDGHCLFRSVASGFLSDFASQPKQAQDRFLGSFFKDIASLKSPRLMELSRHFETALRDIQSKRKTVDSVLTNQATSDSLVAFLRLLACDYNRKFGGREFAASLAGISNVAPAQYLADMADMKKKEYGDELEIAALSKTLRKKIKVLDARSIGQGEAIDSLHTLYGRSPGEPIYLLNRPGHYDLACKGQPVPKKALPIVEIK